MSLFTKIKTFQYKGVIRKSFFFNHFADYPKTAKFLYFFLKRSDDLDHVQYIHDGVHYNSFEDLLHTNPDKYQGIFYGFKYPTKNTDELLFMRKDEE